MPPREGAMFWVRPKQDEQPTGGWELPYADLMSLLMAVFVLICTMSELRAGPRFHSVSGAVRSAFGFAPALPELFPGDASPRPRTLVERLQEAGLRDAAASRAADETLAPCDVATEPDRVVIRVAGPACFDPLSLRLKPVGEAALGRIAGFLSGGEAQVEVRGHTGDGDTPQGLPFRGGLDLSYQRARVAAESLIRAGVAPGRLRVAAMGDSEPLAAGAAGLPGANRRIEIIVHAVKAARAQAFAEKAQRSDGQRGSD